MIAQCRKIIGSHRFVIKFIFQMTAMISDHFHPSHFVRYCRQDRREAPVIGLAGKHTNMESGPHADDQILFKL
jgi:hypothetical protein